MPGVNPYSFVPLGAPVQRDEPTGHEKLADGALCGVLDVSARALTPLRIGSHVSGLVGDHDGVDLFARNALGELIVPGSSLKGAVRSVHEALTNSCLRVLDTEFTPVHRAVPTPDTQRGWHLAVVAEAGEVDGVQIPTSVHLCAEQVLVRATGPGGKATVLSPGQGPWRTGDRLEVTGRGQPHRGSATATGVSQRSDGPWVVLVTDVPAPRLKTPIFFVAGRAWDSNGRPEGVPIRVERGARSVLRLAVSGADDLRPNAVPAGGDPNFAPVAVPGAGATVWKRARVRHQLTAGMPVWVKVTGAGQSRTVTAIKLSQVWRELGQGAMTDRVGDAAPCTDPTRLCPSCRVFGSAGADGDVEEDTVGGTQQTSYAGHVRFQDLTAAGPVLTRARAVTQMMSPKPTAGQFYLDTRRKDVGRRAARNQHPLAHWGSEADTPTPRPIRGRKFYWATSTSTGDGLPRAAANHRVNPVDQDRQATVEVAQPGALFGGRVMFDGLTREQLGGLIAALDPRRVWPGEQVVSRLGGGKPFGWGAAEVTVTVRWSMTAAQRYQDEPPSPVEPDGSDVVGDFVRSIADPTTDPSLVSLRHVLTLDFVADDQVRYPGDFPFWSGTAGAAENTEGGGPLTPLPPATGRRRDQTMGLL